MLASDISEGKQTTSFDATTVAKGKNWRNTLLLAAGIADFREVVYLDCCLDVVKPVSGYKFYA